MRLRGGVSPRSHVTRGGGVTVPVQSRRLWIGLKRPSASLKQLCWARLALMANLISGEYCTNKVTSTFFTGARGPRRRRHTQHRTAR